MIATITSATTNSVALTATGGAATGTITDNDVARRLDQRRDGQRGGRHGHLHGHAQTGATGAGNEVDYATPTARPRPVSDYYTAAAGTVNFLAGETTKTITVSILNDNVYEGAETFNVNLSNAVERDDRRQPGHRHDQGRRHGRAARTTTGRRCRSRCPASVVEDGATNGLHVHAEQRVRVATAVNYTLSGTATSGTDYAAVSGTLTIPAGSLTGTVTIDPTVDTVFEGNETVIATITSASTNSGR